MHALNICLDEIKYRLARIGRANSHSRENSLSQTRSVAVIYLARGRTREELNSIRVFLDSYKRFPAGSAHSFYVIYKGFETESSRSQVQALFDVPHAAIALGDGNLDLGAYIEAAGMVEDDYVFLMNTHSEIRASNWLEKVMSPFADKKIGMVGCTASFESLSPLSPLFPPRPNPHVRSNAFALERFMFVNMMRDEKIATKFDAWLLESGPNSITNRIKSLNKRCVIVDRDGAI